MLIERWGRGVSMLIEIARMGEMTTCMGSAHVGDAHM